MDASAAAERAGLSDLFGTARPLPDTQASPPATTIPPPPEPRSKPQRVKVSASDGPAGHRERLRERFMTEPDSIPDYELLEMLLFRVFARGDTKPLAKALIRHLGSFAEVLNAPAHRLKEVKGVGDRVIEELALVRTTSVRLVRAHAIYKTVFSNWQAVIDYCMTAQAYDGVERFRILFLDKRNQLIADEVQQTGTVDHTPVYVREVLKRGLELGATALILVHNHPSGDPTPSRADIEMTKQIAAAAKPLGMIIHDHIIVGRTGHVSLRAERLM